MNRAEAPEKERIDRELADRARNLAWERRQDAVRGQLRESDRVKARGLGSCPNCSKELELRTLEGAEVGRCPSYDGSWLQSGQLELLMRPGRSLWQRVRRAFAVPNVEGDESKGAARGAI